MPLVIILETDRVKNRFNLPRIRAVSCDGYMVFSEKEIDKQIECAITSRGTHGPSTVRALVRALKNAEEQQNRQFPTCKHFLTAAMMDELERIAAEDKERKKDNGRAETEEKDRKGAKARKG